MKYVSPAGAVARDVSRTLTLVSLFACGASPNAFERLSPPDADGAPAGTGGAAVPAGETGGAASTGGSTESPGTGSGGGGGGVPTGAGGAQGNPPPPDAPTGSGGERGPTPDSDAGRGTGGTTAGTLGTGGRGIGGSGTGGPGAIGGSSQVTVWLAGDSTMANGGNPCPVGWGKGFQAYFNGNIKVNNSAVGGTTLRSWLYDVTSTLGADGECTLASPVPQGRWTAMISGMSDGMKAGDYLFVQFGINDTTAPTCPKHVGTGTFMQLLTMMAKAARDKGATPVFLTAVSSISCNGATAQGTRGGFAAVTKAAAMASNVPLIDLEQLSVGLYTASGFCPSTDTPATFTANGPVGSFFCNDHTHFEAAGATKIAGLVAKAIRDQGLALANDLLP